MADSTNQDSEFEGGQTLSTIEGKMAERKADHEEAMTNSSPSGCADFEPQQQAKSNLTNPGRQGECKDPPIIEHYSKVEPLAGNTSDQFGSEQPNEANEHTSHSIIDGGGLNKDQNPDKGDTDEVQNSTTVELNKGPDPAIGGSNEGQDPTRGQLNKDQDPAMGQLNECPDPIRVVSNENQDPTGGGLNESLDLTTGELSKGQDSTIGGLNKGPDPTRDVSNEGQEPTRGVSSEVLYPTGGGLNKDQDPAMGRLSEGPDPIRGVSNEGQDPTRGGSSEILDPAGRGLNEAPNPTGGGLNGGLDPTGGGLNECPDPIRGELNEGPNHSTGVLNKGQDSAVGGLNEGPDPTRGASNEGVNPTRGVSGEVPDPTTGRSSEVPDPTRSGLNKVQEPTTGELKKCQDPATDGPNATDRLNKDQCLATGGSNEGKDSTINDKNIGGTKEDDSESVASSESDYVDAKSYGSEGSELLFEERITQLRSKCGNDKVVIILHAFINVALWDATISITSDDLKKMMAVRSIIGHWQGNDAQAIAFTPLEEDNSYELKAALIVPRERLLRGIPYKYFLNREGKKKEECFEYIKFSSGGIYNRVVSGKNVHFLGDSLCHHYDDYILPKAPSKSLYERVVSYMSRIGRRRNQALADSMRSQALIFYLSKFSYLFSKPPTDWHTCSDQFKVYQHISEIYCIYDHLKEQLVSKYGEGYSYGVSRMNDDLSNDMTQWIQTAVTETVNNDVESDASLTASLAIGLIILGVAFAADLYGILCDDLSKLFNLCERPPDTVLLGVSRLRELITEEESRCVNIVHFLKSLILIATKRKNNPQCHLGILLFLSIWMDSAEMPAIFDVEEVNSIRNAAKMSMTAIKSWFTDYLSCCQNNLSSYCSNFSKIVLQIAPLNAWPGLMLSNPLGVMFKALSIRIKEKTSSVEVVQDALFKFFQNSCRSLEEKPFGDTEKQEMKELVDSALVTTGEILEGAYEWALRKEAIRMCLYACAHMSLDDGRKIISQLVARTLRAVERTVMITAGQGYTQMFTIFGCKRTSVYSVEICLWSDLLSLCEVRNSFVKQTWTEFCMEEVSSRFQKLEFHDMMEALEANLWTVEASSTDLRKTMMNGAIATFFKFSKDEQKEWILKHSEDSGHFQDIMAAFLDQECPYPSTVNLAHLCTWSMWSCYFRVFSILEGLPSGVDAYLSALEILETTVNCIENGDLTKQELEMMVSNVESIENFTEIVRIYYASKSEMKVMDDVLRRFQELHQLNKEFNIAFHCILQMLQYCEPFLNDKGKDECKKISIFEAKSSYTAVMKLHSCLEHLCPKGLFQKLLEMSASFSSVLKELSCGIVRKVWTLTCTPCELTSLVNERWPCFLDELHHLAEQWINLTISCQHASDLLPAFDEDRELQGMVNVLMKFGHAPVETKDWMHDAIEKVKRYRMATNQLKTAQSLLKVKDTLNLTGNFKTLVSIVNLALSGSSPLSAVDENLVTVLDFLVSCQSQHNLDNLLLAIEEISKSKELINWLQIEVKSIGELRNFITIAQYAHCQDASTRDCLNNLRVVMKLAPFIFQLPPASGLGELMECCTGVQLETLEGASSLLRKCNMSLKRYKEIQRMLGSVEKTVYGQVEDLTKYGVFTFKSPEKYTPKDIQDVVYAVISKDSASKRQYSLDELKDLQSKLALIRGNITDESINAMTELFWEGLELTVRGADALLELLSAGHTHYRDFCFKYALSCTKSSHCQVSAQFKSKVAKMEADLEEWKAKIQDSRGKFYELNYFTARQLSLICQELSRQHLAGVCERFPKWFTNLLQSISPFLDNESVIEVIEDIIRKKKEVRVRELFDLSTSSLPESCKSLDLETNLGEDVVTPGTQLMNGHQFLSIADLNESQKEIFDCLTDLEYSEDLILQGLLVVGSESDFEAVSTYCAQNVDQDVLPETGHHDHSQEDVSKASLEVEEVEEENPLIDRILDEGYSFDLASAACQLFGNDIDAALKYCMDNEDEDTEVIQQELLSSTVNDRTVTLDVTHITYPEASMMSFVPTTVKVPETILWSIEDVGIFLGRVAAMHREKVHHQIQFSEARVLAANCFEKGLPNMIVVQRKNIFQAILSIYMYSENLPLPTAEEVLYCHNRTTAEDIHLLWRRAISDPGYKRIFCLVCEHNLSYKVAKKAVQDLRELMQGHSDFKLVIICCQEDEGSSMLIGDFQEYKRSTPPTPMRDKVIKYLQNHFIDDKGYEVDLGSAGANVDPDGSYVRVVTSGRAGMGKSLYIRRLVEVFQASTPDLSSPHRVITLHGPDIDNDLVVKVLLDQSYDDDNTHPLVYHLDISEGIKEDVGPLLFNILVLCALRDSEGNVWRCRQKNLYTVEITLPHTKDKHCAENCSMDFLQLLPTTVCLSPKECLQQHSVQSKTYFTMDEVLRTSQSYQRVFQYLSRYCSGQPVDEFTYSALRSEGTYKEWIELMIRYFDLTDPSWLELSYFVSFLNSQLTACERSVYCDANWVTDVSTGVTGFKSFVVKFMINMSVDFTVPSLKSEFGIQEQDMDENADALEGYQIVKRRAWEKSVHPYIFFNRDTYRMYEAEEHYDSMTFVGFNLQQVGRTVNLVDLNHKVIEKDIMTDGLYRWLRENGVEIIQDLRSWTKLMILKKLCRVLESRFNFDPDQNDFYFEQIDPDPSYALTFDNMVKMLAIQMRFRCGIPVIIMGETGCGKTRLIRYMCQLQSMLAVDPDKVDGGPPRQTFFIMKVHGGITENDIVQFVKKVQEDAQENQDHGFGTVVFFDEANTTDAIGLIKEIMCDKRMRGQPITEDIKFIAACNPYRKHSDEMIERLESAGLGFFIKVEETRQKLGTVPLRHLVYRVLDLPASMKPLVYDYGGLTANTEEVYISRIVENHVIKNPDLAGITGLVDAVTTILSWCQDYMRSREDECSFVSLRDIERCMIVFEWFHKMYDVFNNEMKSRVDVKRPNPEVEFSASCTMAMTLSLAVCYYTRLLEREDFVEQVTTLFQPPLVLVDGIETFMDTICWCQEIILSNMELGPNIAHNKALRENVFMMTICVELRIPLFVVGKPGSSKSLAKSVVAESMRGRNSEKPFLKMFKSVELLSYQCSQFSTPKSIIDVFDSAKNLLQKEMDYTKEVAVVVLDEVGLAEDSPSMPLKALHPLLEDGTDGSDPREIQVVKREERVAFIGISNWALDPAKMNRGIMVRRGDPDVDELVNSARGICSNDKKNRVRQYLEPMLKDLASAYLKIIESQGGQRKDFFGLRDFYSLIKMLYWLARENEVPYLTLGQFKHAVLRNFGGTDQSDFNPLEFFRECFENHDIIDSENEDDSPCDPLGLIRKSLSSKERTWHGENRYLLFLTENDTALEIMQDYLVNELPPSKPPYVLFGSSFPKDKDYTQVCRNINQIKICMETGRTVVLLNLENLYESLYDLLNQYYTKSMDNHYVDLGLQTHRIKCRVHDDFKLILIAEKDKVYEKFPIPLINRLEKHLVTSSIIMRGEQQMFCSDELKQWVERMADVPGTNFKKEDVFVGYQSETPVAVVFQAYKMCQVAMSNDEWKERITAICKELMINMACPDALARLKQTDMKDEAKEIWDIYFKKQQHLHLSQLLTQNISEVANSEEFESPHPSLSHGHTVRQNSENEADKTQLGVLVQITTYSQPLAPIDVSRLCRELKVNKNALIYMYLEELDAEADFTDRIRKHLQTVPESDAYVLVQCSSGHLNKDLISCARHKAVDILVDFKKEDHWKEKYKKQKRRIHMIFIVSLPKTPGGSKFIAFQGGQWSCVHLDDLRSPEENALNFHIALGTQLSELFYPGREGIALHRRLEKCMAAAVAQLPEALDERGSKEDMLNMLRAVVGCDPSQSLDSTTFYGILVRKMCRLIQQNENAQLEVTKSDWAVREAMDPHRLQEGGTFLNTLLKRIDHTLTDLLAYIVEFLDQHNNLRLCLDGNLRILWLKVFENEHLCQFSYEAKIQRENVTPVVQKLASISVDEYQCQMPFSWIFLTAIEAHIVEHEKLEIDTLYRAVKATHVGAFLHEINDETLQVEELYLKDFIAGVIQPNSSEETEILEQFLRMQSNRLLGPEGARLNRTILLQVLSYHVVYHKNRLQYIHYRELGRIFPTLHEVLLRKFPLEEYKPLDLLAVEDLLLRITPKPVKDKEFWKLQNLRNNYIKNLRDCQNTVDEVLQSAEADCNQMKYKWQKIRAVQMYIEHLVLPLPENEQVYKGAFRLWSMLERLPTSFSDKSCLDRFKTIVNSVDNSIAKALSQADKLARRMAISNVIDEDMKSQNARYAQYCQAVKVLFLEVISVLCFGSGSYEPPKRDLVEGLMKLVFNQEEQRTQNITPFEWEADDNNPVIRSVLLQLILMRDWDDFDVGTLTEEFMTNSISVLTRNDNSGVCALVVRCLEDKTSTPWLHLQEDYDLAWLLERLQREIESSLQPFVKHGQGSPPNYRWLCSIAQLRHCLSFTADILNKYVKDSPERQQLNTRENNVLVQFVQFLSEVLLRNELQDLTLYLSKQIARRHGMKALRTMLSQGHHYVLPRSLHSDNFAQRYPDLYVLCGDTYSDIRKSLVQSAFDESVQAFGKAVQDVPPNEVYCIPLAIFSKITWPVSQIKSFTEEMIEEVETVCLRLGTLNDKLTTLCHSLLARNLGGRSPVMQPSTDVGRHSLVSLVLHTTAVILQNSTNPLLEPFVNVLNAERGLNALYLPTMPEDFLVEAMNIMDMGGQYARRSDMRGKFYACPNGHPYIITECTGPKQGMTCPKCGAHIGAVNSQIARGNYALQKVDRTQTGYTLGDARSRSRDGVPERNLSSLTCAVTRFILHACFLWSSCHCSEESVAHIRGAITVQVQDLAMFFWEHLKLDLIVIGKTLSRGEDEVSLVLSTVINNLSQQHNAVDGSMATKDIRRNWENVFSRTIVEVLGSANDIISDALTKIGQDAEMAQDEVFLAVYEKTEVEATLTQTLLTYRSKISLHDLTAALANTPNAQQQYPLLYRFLMNEPLLRALQYLPYVVQLQRVLTSCFSHKLDYDETSELSIAGALDDIGESDEERSKLVRCLHCTREAWKIVRERLPHHRISVPDDEVKVLADIADVLPVAYLLPSTSGPGLCSLALSDFLLFQQNELLEFCQNSSKYSGFTRKSIPLTQLLPFHMISYEGEIDTVILTHCRYSLRFGKGQQVEYDFGALEKHIYDRFLVGKPWIDRSTQPMMIFSSDDIQQDVFEQLKKNIKPQVSLSPEDQKDVLRRCHRKNLREISEALHILTIAISFLASKGGDSNMPLSRYIISVLRIRKTEFCKRYTLSHVLSLWETLALEKAKQQAVAQKEIPFDGFDRSTKERFENLSPSCKETLVRCLRKFKLDSLMMLLFKFIQLGLKSLGPSVFEWPLVDALDAYIDKVDDNNVKDLQGSLDQIPEDILVKNVVHVWHITVQYKMTK